MKKIRIMLTAISLIAVVGGVLAFKAMTPTDYCTALPFTTALGGPAFCQNIGTTYACPNFANDIIVTTTTTNVNVFCTTTPEPDGTPCHLRGGSEPLKCGPAKVKVTVE